LVIIWLKRWLARSLTETALEFDPVGVDVGVGVGLGEGDGLGDGLGEGLGEGLGDGDGLCADAGAVSAGISISENAAVIATEKTTLRTKLAIVSDRTACRWDRCRHRRA
jgi:hypothetical protein